MSKPRLKLPLGEHLEDRLPEGRVHRLWQRLESARGARRIVPRSAWGFAALGALIASVVVLFVDHAINPGVLHLADGRAVPGAMGADARSTIALDDGSSLDVSAGGRLEVLESTGRQFALALRQGTTEFEVHPGGPRAWRIECAGVVIEVVGTHFTVMRGREELRVSVERGIVLVRGDTVPDRVVRLSAGQSIVVPLQASIAAPVASSASEPDAGHGAALATGGSTLAVAGGLAARRTPASADQEPDGVEKTDKTSDPATLLVAPNRAAFPAANSAGAPASDVEALMTSADALRRAGRFREAAAVLQRILNERGNDPRASLAEFSLARLELDSLGSAAAAAEHFSRALARGLPAALAEDASARLVEAEARAGNRLGAERAASEYRARYPDGRRRVDVNRWASGSF